MPISAWIHSSTYSQGRIEICFSLKLFCLKFEEEQSLISTNGIYVWIVPDYAARAMEYILNDDMKCFVCNTLIRKQHNQSICRCEWGEDGSNDSETSFNRSNIAAVYFKSLTCFNNIHMCLLDNCHKKCVQLLLDDSHALYGTWSPQTFMSILPCSCNPRATDTYRYGKKVEGQTSDPLVSLLPD